jgi:hypothetical protein
MTISRSQMPRQMYGLGSLVKSIGKTVKKVVKSPIGKAAILGFTGAGLMGLGPLSGLGGFGAKMGSLFSGGGAGLGSMFGKVKNLYSGLSGAQKLMGAGSLGLAALAGAPEEVQMESQRNVGALRKYLSSYYKNLGYSDNQIAENVARDTSEYTSGQGGYAMGGRVNYQSGTPKQEIVKPSDSMMVDTTTSNPMPKEKSLKENLDFVKETKGGVSPSTTMYMFKMYLDEALKKGQITKEKYNKMLMPFFGKTSEGVTRDFERYEQSMAYGGRMGYAEGMEPLNVLAELSRDLPKSLGPNKIKRDKDGKIIPPPPPLKGPNKIKRDKDGKIIPSSPPLLMPIKMPDPLEKILKNMTPEERKRREIINKNNAATYKKIQQSVMEKLLKIREGMPENERNMRPVPIRKIGPEGISGMAYGGRINRAYGSDDLVEQASGIEGLDININPKGVKELDLRETGGFIPPVGVKEKADDIPAMLSNNEFVFTADAVRAAGGGSVNKGAQIMYDTMKKLENGGTV